MNRAELCRIIELPRNASLSQTAAENDADFRLGIVCMTKRPANFETWLAYHRDVVGVARFYLRVEDTPWLEPYLSQPPWCDCVQANFARATVRDWADQTARQMTHVTISINCARKDGVTHLLHCDDDEVQRGA